MPRRKKLPPNVRRHGNAFRAVITRDGRRERGPTMDTVEEVVKWLAAYRAAEATPAAHPVTLTLAGGLQLIRDDLAATDARPATRQFYENHARVLIEALGGDDVGLDEITQAQLAAFIDQRRRAGIAASTVVGKELFVLRRMRKLAIGEGYFLPTDPFAGLRVPKVRMQRFAHLTKQRVSELLAAMRKHRAWKAKWHADIVETLFATGLRLSELARLRAKDIDFEAGHLSVEGKTGHRHQTFPAWLEPTLRRLIAAADADGQLVTVDAIEKMFPSWQRRLGEPNFSAHVLRHSYATEMAEHVEPFELMTLMDHKDLRQTSRYYHGRGSAIRGALDALRPDPPGPERPGPGARRPRR